MQFGSQLNRNSFSRRSESEGVQVNALVMVVLIERRSGLQEQRRRTNGHSEAGRGLESGGNLHVPLLSNSSSSSMRALAASLGVKPGATSLSQLPPEQ